MPCSSGYSAEADARELRQELERVTRVACDLARFVNERACVRDETRAWVKAHEKADRERLRREREDADRELLRKRALKKLTPEERRLLGI